MEITSEHLSGLLTAVKRGNSSATSISSTERLCHNVWFQEKKKPLL